MDSELMHRPVLLDEAVEALHIRPGGRYVDGTFGRGGHSGAILGRLNDDGGLLAFDKDPAALESAKRFLGDRRFSMVRGSFAMLRPTAEARGLLGRIDGVLLDLGVSSPQIDDPTRGFSFQNDGPLDMRMDNASGPTAADWVATASEDEMAQVFREYGEERFARRVARAIVAARGDRAILSTARLAAIVADAIPTRERGKNPATRTFQAIRIRINRELDDLDEALLQAVDCLAAGGRLAVISFHSLEDRRVKRFMRDESRGRPVPRGVPVRADHPTGARLRLVGKAMKAGDEELRANPRARSAVLRVAERLPGDGAAVGGVA
ncbi:MAG: 16S rRNA (cytosine(1402)-N(4))-methyltransferase RsmH [Gammaproteobacteria bacterium]